MKNIILSLLLALGFSNISASTDTTTELAGEISALIAQEDAETQAGVLSWMKNNPVKFGTLLLVSAGVVTYGAYAYKAYDKETGYVEALKAPGVAAYNFADKHARCAAGCVKGGFNATVTLADQNRLMAAGAATLAVVVVALIVDLARKDGYLKRACSKASSEIATAEAK
jgi:hypothetical protein